MIRVDRRRVRSLSGALVAVVALSFAAPARADGDEAAGRVLFEDGRKLMDEGKVEEACARFAEGQRVSPGIGMKFNLAECFERQGKLASAWAAFLDVAAQARLSGQSERERVARRRASALEGELARLTIAVPRIAAVPGIAVKRDGIDVGPGQWGVPIPVDPGPHMVVVTAPGRRPFEREVKIGTQAGSMSTIDVPVLAIDPNAKEKATTAVLEDPNRGKGQRTIGLAAGGVGAAGLVVGTAFGLLAMSKFGESADHCFPGNVCDPVGVSLRDDAITNGNISTVGFVAGGVLAVAGAVLYFTAPSSTVRVGATSTLGVRF